MTRAHSRVRGSARLARGALGIGSLVLAFCLGGTPEIEGPSASAGELREVDGRGFLTGSAPDGVFWRIDSGRVVGATWWRLAPGQPARWRNALPRETAAGSGPRIRTFDGGDFAFPTEFVPAPAGMKSPIPVPTRARAPRFPGPPVPAPSPYAPSAPPPAGQPACGGGKCG